MGISDEQEEEEEKKEEELEVAGRGGLRDSH